MIDLEERFRRLQASGRKILVPYVTGYVPGWADAVRVAVANGADAVEVGLPFSDPVMDGPVIQRASTIALNAVQRREPSLMRFEISTSKSLS